MDLPEWFTNQMHGWFTFAFVSEKKLAKIAGKDSQLTRLVLKAFFTEQNFAVVGIVVVAGAQPDGAKPAAFWFRAVFEAFLTDADGHHKTTMCRGASGTKCCAKCNNVVGRCKPSDIKPGSSLVHFTCGDISRMQRLSPN